MLTDSEIKRAITVGHFLSDRNKDDHGQPVKVASKLDGDNLWIEIMDSGIACWRFRFISPATGRPARMSVGIYPATGLSQARSNAGEARKLVAAGKDPVAERKAAKEATRARRTFDAVITEWFVAFRESDMSRSKSTRATDLRTRDQLIELFGKAAIASITTPEIQATLIGVANADGHKAKARTLRAMLNEVFMYAIAKKECTLNPAAAIMFKLPKITTKQLAAIISPREVGELLRRIAGYDGTVFTRAALEVMARTVPRPANIAAMRWDEIVDGVWIIPAGKMKMRRQHKVPLSRQVLALLAELRKLTNGPFVFSRDDKPMGSKTLNRALRALGYTAEQHTAHGFRSTFSTLLRAEARWPVDIIELQLAHGDPDKVAAAYNRVHEFDALINEGRVDISDRLWQVRAKMMQYWSDRLDALAADQAPSNVVELQQAA
jgi:integrase